ncbi:MAG TPA: hypothetical protein VF727_15125 [Allosphingosinicella sp.]
MKIVTGETPPRTFAAPAAAAGAPQEPFASFLAEAATGPARPRERAFGFAELSLFGLAHSQAAPTDTAPRLQAGSISPEAAGAILPAALALAAPAEAVVVRPGASAAVSGPSGPEEKSCRLPLRSADSGPAASPAAASVGADDPFLEALEVPERPAQRGAMRQASGRPSGALSLILIDADGRLQLIAGAPQLDQRSREALRRSAEAIAAEYGFSLSRLTLNGEPLHPHRPVFRRT